MLLSARFQFLPDDGLASEKTWSDDGDINIPKIDGRDKTDNLLYHCRVCVEGVRGRVCV